MIKPLYKAQAPFMEIKNGYGYQGVVMWDSEEDKIQCHLCGTWHKVLWNHIRCKHKMNLDDYKMKYGLSLRTALCGRSVSRSHSKASMKLYKQDSSFLKQANKASRKEKTHRRIPKLPRQYYNQTMQAKNSRGLCDLQIRARYVVVKKMVHREPTAGDLMEYDRKLYGVICQRYGLNKFRKIFGIKPLNRNEYRMIPDIDLIASLRKFAKSINSKQVRVEAFKKVRDVSIYYRRFGSWHNALRIAGLT